MELCSAILRHSAPITSLSARLRAKLRRKIFAFQTSALAIPPPRIFITAADPMLQLSAAYGRGRLKEYFNRPIVGPGPLIVDELSDLPFGRDEASLYFNVVAKRHDRGSMLLTSDLPLAQWVSNFADDQTLVAGTLDRLLHHAHIIKIAGKSDRLIDKRKARGIPNAEASATR